MNSLLLDFLENLAQSIVPELASGKLTPEGAVALLTRLSHGPFINLAVRLTPTPFDDAVLSFLKVAFPKK